MFLQSIKKIVTHSGEPRALVLKVLQPFLLLGGFILLFTLPGAASAVTLGQATLKSGPGARLNMQIELKSITAAQAGGLQFTLLTKDKYKASGYRYSAVLASLRFAVKKRTNGQYFLSVSSTQPINVKELQIALMMKSNSKPARLVQVYTLQMASKKVIARQPTPVPPIMITKPIKQLSEEREMTQKSTKALEPSLSAKPAPKPAPAPVTKQSPIAMQDEVAAKQASKPLMITMNGDDAPKANGETAAKGNGETAMAITAPDAVPATFDRYQVNLTADKELKKPGPPGVLKVWIGDPAFAPAAEPDKAQAETTLPAIGQTAKVIPMAPMFIIEPAEYICMKIHPSGSEAVFSLTPKDTGTYEVGASVHLYESADCSGPPVPKSVASLQVSVVVNTGEVIEGYGLQLWEKLWKGFLDFWGWIVTAVFGLLTFLIRKRLKKLFGYDA